MRQPFLLKSKKPTGLDEGIGMIKTGKKSLQNQKTAYLFILPAMIVLTIFVFVPLIAAFVISFLNMDIYMKDISFAMELQITSRCFGMTECGMPPEIRFGLQF